MKIFHTISYPALKDKEVIEQFRDVTGFQNIQDSVNSPGRNIENLKKTFKDKRCCHHGSKRGSKKFNHEVDDFEQYSRRITGIPENEYEDIEKSVFFEMINNRMKIEPQVRPMN